MFFSQVSFSPHFRSSSYFSTSTYVVQKIDGQLPHVSLDFFFLSEPFNDLKLADATFYKSFSVDVLLEFNIALPVLKGQMLSYGDGKHFTVCSELGCFIVRNVSAPNGSPVIQVNSTNLVNEQLIQKFWGLRSCHKFTNIRGKVM